MLIAIAVLGWASWNHNREPNYRHRIRCEMENNGNAHENDR